MSVTYTCKRIASAFRKKDGEVVYVLHEVVYESNVYPHTKNIYTVCVGDYRTCLETIFNYAGVTEWGSLNSPDKRMTPERYIKSWLNAMKHPYLMDADSPLDISETYSWYKEGLEKLKMVIQEKGIPPTIGNYYKEINEMSAYFTVRHEFTDEGKAYLGAVQSKELGYNPKLSAAAPVKAFENSVYRIKSNSEDNYIIIDAFGDNLNKPNWEYSVVSSFVVGLFEHETSFPGSYRGEIAAFRERLRKTPVTNKLRCFLGSEDDEYHGKTVRELKNKYGDGFVLADVEKEDLYDVIRCVDKYEAL